MCLQGFACGGVPDSDDAISAVDGQPLAIRGPGQVCRIACRSPLDTDQPVTFAGSGVPYAWPHRVVGGRKIGCYPVTSAPGDLAEAGCPSKKATPARFGHHRSGSRRRPTRAQSGFHRETIRLQKTRVLRVSPRKRFSPVLASQTGASPPISRLPTISSPDGETCVHKPLCCVAFVPRRELPIPRRLRDRIP